MTWDGDSTMTWDGDSTVAMLLDIYFWCIYVCVGVQLCSPTHALVNVYKPYDCPFIAVC